MSKLGRFRSAFVALVIAGSALLVPLRALADPASCPPGLAKQGKCPQPTAVPTPPPPSQTSTTTLLFSFVTNQAGFDTGISIANTSLDTVGTPPETGSCTINYFGSVSGGGPAPAPQTTTTNIPAGQSLTFVVSSGGGFGIAGRPGFQGYIIVTCGFRYAHGFALITDGPIGQARIAGSYLGLVIPEGGRSTDDEQLAH